MLLLLKMAKKYLLTILLLLLLIPNNISPVKAAGYTYKVTRNHQRTCDETIEWGNEVHITVKDENGKPMPGVDIEYWHDYPVPAEPCNPGLPLPSGIITTEGDGKKVFFDSWPGCLGKQYGDLDYKKINFFFRVKGFPSDTAVEISTSFFDNICGGSFCEGAAYEHRNCWGHWFYDIDFQRKAGDLPVDEIPMDHAGMMNKYSNYQAGKCQFWDTYIPNVSYNPKRSGSIDVTATPVPPKNPTLTPIPPTQKSPTPKPYNTAIPGLPTKVPTQKPTQNPLITQSQVYPTADPAITNYYPGPDIPTYSPGEEEPSPVSVHKNPISFPDIISPVKWIIAFASTKLDYFFRTVLP